MTAYLLPALQSSPNRPTPVMRNRTLQRKCACGGTAGPTGECEECRKKREAGVLRRLASNGQTSTLDSQPLVAPPIVHEVLRSPGRPLDAETRAFMEPRFGYDLSKVRPHASGFTDARGDLKIGAVDDPAEHAAEAVASRIAGMSPDSGGHQSHHDFSRVRVHTGAKAAESAQAIGARAYAVGHDVVFNDGQYDPRSNRGHQLLAHELAHVVQQETASQPASIRRDFKTKDMLNDALPGMIEDLIEKIKTHPAYVKLGPEYDDLKESIFWEISKEEKHSKLEQFGLLTKLLELFNTREMTTDEVSGVMQDRTAETVKEEKARLAKPEEAKNVGREEKAAADPKRKWTYLEGRSRGGNYRVDRTSYTDIVLQASIHLTPVWDRKQDGKDAEREAAARKTVEDIKFLEDAIEKAASTEGYTVDIIFVDADETDPKTKLRPFKVDVNPGVKETESNWSGGKAVGFAHEIHHLLAFPLDRYDYIEDQRKNEKMRVPSRLHWFLVELTKKKGFNDPSSIMAKAAHPNERDACAAAGFSGSDLDACVQAKTTAHATQKP
jgi:Domain of unknown function (DUF4157)